MVDDLLRGLVGQVDRDLAVLDGVIHDKLEAGPGGEAREQPVRVHAHRVHGDAAAGDDDLRLAGVLRVLRRLRPLRLRLLFRGDGQARGSHRTGAGDRQHQANDAGETRPM